MIIECAARGCFTGRIRRGRVLFLTIVFLFAGCTTGHYRRSADKEAARIIAEKTPAVPNMDPHFSVEQEKPGSLADLPVNEQADESLGAEKEVERGAHMLSLEKTLAVAIKHSREYQNQKELLFLAALNLSLVRHNYTPIFSGGANTRAQNQPTDVAKAIDQAAGTQTSLLQRDTQVVQQYNATGQGNVGAQVLLRSGARLVNSFNIDFLRFLNGNPQWFVRSSLMGTLTQPLLRGAGYKVAMENLTQAERTMLYALRDFTQARKDFTVRVAQSYYGVLGARDAVRNAWRGYQNLKQNVEQARALAAEGRIPQSDLGQVEQDSFTRETDWISAIRTYKTLLDQFKILIGLTTDARVIMNDQELEQLQIVHPRIVAEDAVRVALTTRLDLATVRDRREDADRQARVAANALKPGLNLVVTGNLDSKPGNINPFDLDFERARGSVGLNTDLPLDRKAERNRYRAALIEKERTSRQAELLEDQVKLQVYESWRSLEQAKRNYELSELGLKLAERRVEEQNLRAELGKITGLALVSAQSALIASRNARTTALVNHTITRLQFWNNMGILYVKENGQWEELDDAKSKPN